MMFCRILLLNLKDNDIKISPNIPWFIIIRHSKPLCRKVVNGQDLNVPTDKSLEFNSSCNLETFVSVKASNFPVTGDRMNVGGNLTLTQVFDFIHVITDKIIV
jgi:hypothetical protein